MQLKRINSNNNRSFGMWHKQGLYRLEDIIINTALKNKNNMCQTVNKCANLIEKIDKSPYHLTSCVLDPKNNAFRLRAKLLIASGVNRATKQSIKDTVGGYRSNMLHQDCTLGNIFSELQNLEEYISTSSKKCSFVDESFTSKLFIKSKKKRK